MVMRSDDTIVALSSGAVPSGVAVVRLSGPLAGTVLVEMLGALPAPRRLQLADVRLDGELIDRGLIAWMPGPHSFTGEDCAELQVHGSPAVVRTLLRRLSARPGLRLAEAGEFSRRAFENGKLDLTEVEGLGDLISSETEGQRRLALARLDGALSQRLDGWREALLDIRAEIEARLDFSDEGDVDAELPATVLRRLEGVRDELDAAAASLGAGRIVREGLRVALAGPPNVGKSSLLNALAKSDVAIVTDEPGTTRDVREVAIDLGGQLVILVDMAGLRETDSKAEAEGVRRAQREIGQADLVLWLRAPDVPADASPDTAADVWVVQSKSDLQPIAGELAVSSQTGSGIESLLARIGAFAEARVGGEPPLVSRERDVAAIGAARLAIEDCISHMAEEELAAEDLRRASDALARLLGKMDVEAVLDRLFSAFCIGK